jgi:hypothetical protein
VTHRPEEAVNECHLVAFAPPSPAIARLAAGRVVALTRRASFDLRAHDVPHRRHTDLADVADWVGTNAEIHARLVTATGRAGALPPLLDLFSNFLVSEVNHDFWLAHVVRAAVELERPRRCVLWVHHDSFENPRRYAIVERTLARLGMPFERGVP